MTARAELVVLLTNPPPPPDSPPHSPVTWGALWDQKVCIMLVSAQGQTHMAPQAPSATTTPVRIANRQSPWREGGKTNPTHPTSNDQTGRTNNRQKRNRWRFKLKRTRKGGFAERCFQKVGFQRRGRPAPLRNKSGAGGPNTPPLKTPTSQNTLFDTPLHKTPSCRVVEKR